MLYVVGLGNPGPEYIDTPHNIGWQLVDELVTVFAAGSLHKNGSSYRTSTHIGEEKVVIIKPTTFMNRSGDALREFDIVDPQEVVVIYDDIDLPFGQIKLSRNRGNGGHNGIKSIEAALGSRDFIRLRIGVCPTDWFGNPRKPRGKDAVSRYLVHKKLSSRHTKEYRAIASKMKRALESLVQEGYEKTISQFPTV